MQGQSASCTHLHWPIAICLTTRGSGPLSKTFKNLLNHLSFIVIWHVHTTKVGQRPQPALRLSRPWPCPWRSAQKAKLGSQWEVGVSHLPWSPPGPPWPRYWAVAVGAAQRATNRRGPQQCFPPRPGVENEWLNWFICDATHIMKIISIHISPVDRIA